MTDEEIQAELAVQYRLRTEYRALARFNDEQANQCDGRIDMLENQLDGQRSIFDEVAVNC